ncbi:MAG: MBL fold metallo-hydrolase [bacterium]|nr:MBL fold metallo-hydrolase [bacterium]
MTITSYGAAGGVTGSKHLIATGRATVLLDCGIFQGPGSQGRNRDIPFPPTSVDAVVISHAHTDHTAMLPVLVREGFAGRVFATAATRDVMRHILTDSAMIAMEDAAYKRRHAIGDAEDWEPTMTPRDVTRAMERVDVLPYARDNDAWHEIADGVTLKFYDAGHILGSSVIVLRLRGDDGERTLCFSGDLGARHVPILRDPEVPREPCTTLLCETTYGDQAHPSFDGAIDALADAVTRGVARGAKIIVPAFSLGRTQLLVYLLHKLVNAGRIPSVPIVIDSPLATELTEVFEQYRDTFDAQSREDFPSTSTSPLTFHELRSTHSIEESKALNDVAGPIVIISASGMMTNGRIVHHLRHNIADATAMILITGYQAEGTTGRAILDGAPQVELHGETYPVRAEVVHFEAFSAHADQGQLLAWAGAIPGIRHAILVHGEQTPRSTFANVLAAAHPDWRIDAPGEGDTLPL